MEVCDLGRTNIILGIPWLAAYNLEIYLETGKVKMMRCPPFCRRKIEIRRKKEEDRKDLRWTMDDRMKEEEVAEDRRRVENMVSKRFHKWLKVFRKQKPEKMLVWKP